MGYIYYIRKQMYLLLRKITKIVTHSDLDLIILFSKCLDFQMYCMTTAAKIQFWMITTNVEVCIR